MKTRSLKVEIESYRTSAHVRQLSGAQERNICIYMHVPIRSAHECLKVLGAYWRVEFHVGNKFRGSCRLILKHCMCSLFRNQASGNECESRIFRVSTLS